MKMLKSIQRKKFFLPSIKQVLPVNSVNKSPNEISSGLTSVQLLFLSGESGRKIVVDHSFKNFSFLSMFSAVFMPCSVPSSTARRV